TRTQSPTIAVIGTLTVDGEFNCYTLENAAVLIPAGRYEVTLYESPHAGHIVPLLNGVPGRDHIEIHCGNVPTDSKGCILVGTEHTDSSLLASRLAFDNL